MRGLLDPALIVAVFALVLAGNIAAEECSRESVDSNPGSAQFDSLCRNLMSQALRQANLNFEKSSDEIRTSARATLDEIIEIIFDCPSLVIVVTGHTDNTGEEAANRALSKARAESIVAYLTERGIDPGRLSASGVGSDTPIASNDTIAGRQLNRRIVFELSVRRTKRGPTTF